MKVKVVYVAITNQCNLNCRTCYNRSGLNRVREAIPPGKLEEIVLLIGHPIRVQETPAGKCASSTVIV